MTEMLCMRYTKIQLKKSCKIKGKKTSKPNKYLAKEITTRFFLKNILLAGHGAHTFSPTTWETEAGRFL